MSTMSQAPRWAKVAHSDWTDDYTQAIVSVTPTITKEGQYKVVIDAETYCDYVNTDVLSEEGILYYAIGQTVVKPDGKLRLLSQSPRSDEKVNELKTIEFKFNKAVTLVKAPDYKKANIWYALISAGMVSR